MRWRTQVKDASLRLLDAALDRHVVLLPASARDEGALLDVDAPYRVDEGVLCVRVREPARGRLRITLLAYEGHFPTRPLLRTPELAYNGPCDLVLDLRAGRMKLGDTDAGEVSLPLPGRRFCLALDWSDTLASRRRTTSHYLTASGAITEAYYQGDNYVDHEAESAGEHAIVAGLLAEHQGAGPILEIGCATGGLLAALRAAGHRAYGVDISTWAVDRANERLGGASAAGRAAWVCDAGSEALPAELVAQGPFGSVVMWAVLEHFVDPFATLAKLGGSIAPGGLLVVNTTNADSLTHQLFGRQWEGHFDGSHFGVERISLRSLGEQLPRLGWDIVRLDSHLVWDTSADPLHATLREWYAADARFRRLIAETGRGDLITCVARKTRQ